MFKLYNLPNSKFLLIIREILFFAIRLLTTFRYITNLFLTTIIQIDVTPWLWFGTTGISTEGMTTCELRMIRYLKIKLIYPTQTGTTGYTSFHNTAIRVSSAPITIVICKKKWYRNLFFSFVFGAGGWTKDSGCSKAQEKHRLLSWTLFSVEMPMLMQSAASGVSSSGRSEHSTSGTCLPISGCLLAIAYSFLHRSFSSISHSLRQIFRSLRFKLSFLAVRESPYVVLMILRLIPAIIGIIKPPSGRDFGF
jgi:hypothetical protein